MKAPPPPVWWDMVKQNCPVCYRAVPVSQTSDGKRIHRKRTVDLMAKHRRRAHPSIWVRLRRWHNR